MEPKMLLFILFVIGLLIYLVTLYNQLVAAKNIYENSFAQIEVQLKRRYDLIPNLVETAKRYLKHESEVLERVIRARNQAMALVDAGVMGKGNKVAALGQAESALAAALGGLQITMESYPELKADASLRDLHESLTHTENRIAFARQAFNDGVTEYNILRSSLPTVLLAGFVGHGSNASLLEMPDSAAIQQAPKIEL